MILDTPKPYYASSLSNQLKHQNNTCLRQDNMNHDQIQCKNHNQTRLELGFTSLEIKYREMEMVFGICESCGGWLVADGSSWWRQ